MEISETPSEYAENRLCLILPFCLFVHTGYCQYRQHFSAATRHNRYHRQRWMGYYPIASSRSRAVFSPNVKILQFSQLLKFNRVAKTMARNFPRDSCENCGAISDEDFQKLERRLKKTAYRHQFGNFLANVTEPHTGRTQCGQKTKGIFVVR